MEPEKLNAYGKSKTLAEKAAWDYVKELPGTSQANRQQFQLQFGHTIIINILSIVTTFHINFKFQMRYVLVKYFITCICSAYEIHVTANSMRPPSSIIGIIW